MIEAGIIGASGYTGQELYRLLAGHPEVSLKLITSRSHAGTPFEQLYGTFSGTESLRFTALSAPEAAEQCDVLFLALPHGIASETVTAEMLQRCRVIDLGPDYRLSAQSTYEQWYRTPHRSPELLKEAVYGLCELKRDALRSARLVANPGCYTTCSILTAVPLLAASLIDPESIVIDAKSGVSGAGREAKTGSLFCECNESIKAYGVGTHRHTPEIEQELSLFAEHPITVSFTPHLVPMNRGILITLYAALKPGVTREAVDAAYRRHYGSERFIRLLPAGAFPETRWVTGSNYCDIGYTLDPRTGRIIAGGAIDNLVKGAAGQAVQNMNILFGLPEETGLGQLPLFPA